MLGAQGVGGALRHGDMLDFRARVGPPSLRVLVVVGVRVRWPLVNGMHLGSIG